MSSNQGPHSKGLEKEIAVFRGEIERYAAFCKEANIRAMAYQEASLPLFQRLNAEERNAALQTVRDANEIFQMMQIEHLSLTDNKRLLWRALSRWGLSPSSETFDLIVEGDFVQVYSEQNIALFWSPDLMSMLSLTLEQIFTQPWYTNVVRSEADSAILLEAAGKVFGGDVKTPFHLNMPEHYLKEVNSYGDNEFMMKIKWICPLRKEGKIRALLLTHTCRLLSSKLGMD